MALSEANWPSRVWENSRWAGRDLRPFYVEFNLCTKNNVDKVIAVNSF